MDESLNAAPVADDWRASLAQRVDDNRRAARARFDERKSRLRELEGKIAGQFDALTQAVAHEGRQLGALDQRQRDQDTRQQELAARQGELAEESRDLQQREAALARREAEVEQLAAELDRRQASLTGAIGDLDHQRGELEKSRAALQSESDVLKREQAEVRKLQSELQLKQQTLAEREQATQRQRRQIAQQLRAKKHELASEIELHRAEALASASGQDLQLQMKLSELQGKYEQIKEEFDTHQQQRDDAAQKLAEFKGQSEARASELAHQRKELEESQRKLGELEATRRGLEQKLEQLQKSQAAASGEQAQALDKQLQELQKSHAASQAQWNEQKDSLEKDLAAAKKSGGKGGADPAELTRLREENKQLEKWLAEAEAKAKAAAAGGGGDKDMEDVQRRFEMALQDVRELKAKNSELSDQLAKAKQAGASAAAGGGGGGNDWESMKKNLLAQLETDFDAADEKQSADKMTVEGAIKITDRVVAEKEQEIEELRRLLDSQAQNVGEMAVGAAAIAQALDGDEIVRQERENLKQLQESVREQCKKLEVDLALERAKIARERAEMEERLRAWESERAAAGVVETPNGDKGRKGARGGKWLARLGLQGGKEE